MSQSPADKAKAAIASAQSQIAAAVQAAKAQDAIKQAADQALAAKATEQALAASQAIADQAAATAKWKQVELTMEDAMEHAGISGIDAQIDSNGFARLVGQVGSEDDRLTAIAMAEQFHVTGLDVQLEVVPPVVDNTTVPAPTDAPVKYKVKAGESWWGIAHRVYGDGQLWKSLKAANNNPKMIHPGTEIILPPKSALSH